MDEETKKRLEEMTLEEQKARFRELRKQLVAEPTSIVGWRKSPAVSLKEHEEYQFLKHLLGYN